MAESRKVYGVQIRKLQISFIKKAEEKKQFFLKIREFQIYFDGLTSKIQKREKAKQYLTNLCEDLKREPVEYKQILEKNIEVQIKTLALIRAIFFVEKQFQRRFVQKLRFELSPGQVSQYKILLDALKSRNVTFNSVQMLNPKQFAELFEFSNPLAKLKKLHHTENKKSFVNFLRRNSRVGSRSKGGSSSQFEDDNEATALLSKNNNAVSSAERRSSFYHHRNTMDSQQGSSHVKNLKFKIQVTTEKEANRKSIDLRNISKSKECPKQSSGSSLTKSKVLKNESAEAKNPFFYRVKDKEKEKDKARRLSINVEGKVEPVVNENLLASESQDEVKPQIQTSNISSNQNQQKTSERKSKGKQVLFESLKQISQEIINEHETSRRTLKHSAKSLLQDKQSNAPAESVPSYMDYPIFLKETNNDYRLFLTGQIIVQIFLEIMAESPESLFDPLSSAYESIEEEVATHFHTYLYLKHLANIKHNFLRQLEQQGLVRSHSNGQDGNQMNRGDDPASPSSNFFQQKSEKLTELSFANIRSISRINGLHSVILQACDCSQNLTSVNNLDAQMILIERLCTEKKLLAEKDLSLQKIKELEQQLDLKSCDPLFSFSKFLKERAPSMDPRKLEVIEYLAEHIVLLKNFAARSKLAIFNRPEGFDFEECSDHILEHLASVVQRLIEIFKLKFHLIQNFLFSLDRFLNSRQRNISAKHREKLILNIEKYSTTEQVVNNRARREKFQTIIKQLNHVKSGGGSQSEMPGGKDNKENGEAVGQRFLRNTNQDNTLVKSHFETILREHSLNKSLNISKGREKHEVAIEKAEKSAIMVNKEMSFNFQMLQRLKHSEVIRPNQDSAEEDSAN